MNLRFLKYVALSCLASILAAFLTNARADDLFFNTRGELTGEVTTVAALKEMHKSADKQRKKPCTEYDPHAYSSQNRRLDGNGNLVIEVVCKDDNRQYKIVVNRTDFVLQSCSRTCPTCRSMLECDAKLSESEKSAQMRQLCLAQKETCKASCPPWRSGANNDSHFSCNGRCDSIVCK